MNPFGEESEELIQPVPAASDNKPKTKHKRSKGTFGHSTAVVNKKLYLWGGWEKGFPEIHSSAQKIQLISKVDVFNLEEGKWDTQDTTGQPPLGVRGYSCTSVGSNIYYFGGYCGHDWCRHSTLSCFDTINLQWKEVSKVNDKNSPMKKNACGMVSFSEDGKEYLFVFGGVGMLCSANQPEAIYIPWKENPDYGWTNESHVFYLDTGEWITPKVKGDCPPPCAGFTLTKISQNSAVLFGGFDSTTNTCLSDVYIVELSKESILWHKLKIASQTKPVARHDHATVCIAGPLFGQNTSTLLIVGGRDKHWKTLSDVWLLDCANGNWHKLEVSQSVSHRHFHSAAVFPVSDHCVYIIVFGGVKDWLQTNASNQPILSDTAVIELCLNGSQWKVNAVLDNETTKDYMSHLIQHLFESTQVKQNPANSSDSSSMVAQLRNQLQEAQLALKLSEEKIESLEKAINEIPPPDSSLKLRALKAERIAVEVTGDVLKPYLIERNEIQLTGPIIDKGSYGQTTVAQYKGIQVAAKVLNEIPSSDFNNVVLHHLLIKSVQIRHPNIVQLLFASIEKEIVLVTEMHQLKLCHELDKRSIPKQEKINILYDVASALLYLHSVHVVHRGVSSSNIVLDQLPLKWHAKLTDFFTGNILYNTSTADVLESVYIAPDASFIPQELWPKVDIFSFGIITIEVATYNLPAVNVQEREEQLNAIEWPALVNVIKSCTNPKSVERPSAQQLLDLLHKLF